MYERESATSIKGGPDGNALTSRKTVETDKYATDIGSRGVVIW